MINDFKEISSPKNISIPVFLLQMLCYIFNMYIIVYIVHVHIHIMAFITPNYSGEVEHGQCAAVKFLTNIKTAKSQFVLTAATENCVNVSIHVSVSMFQDVCTHASSGLW